MILLIDDSPEDRELFTYFLRKSKPDTDVKACHGGEDGIRAAQTMHFDCVLLDLRLAGEDGLEVLVEIKKTCPDLPVIVFTGLGSERAAVDAFVAGAAYYLPKHDLTAETLWTAIERVTQQAALARELKSKREAMERSNRLDAVGQLAAGIAHDFNNQLATLRMSIDLLKPLATTERSKEHIKTALATIGQGSSLATRLLALSRQGDLMAQNVSIKEIFTDLRALGETAISEPVTLNIGEPGSDLVAFCDPGQLLNALFNLLLNASDAIRMKGEAGEILIRAAPVENDPSRLRITVSDSGIGMGETVLSKASDPFFTTKQDRNGTGLGLATVQSFAQGNGGFLTLDSTLGVGTEITMVLPTGMRDAKPTPDAKSIETAPRTTARVLVIEDNFELGMLLREVLELNGHDVLTARTAQSALEILESEESFDVFLTDINIPGQNGFELAQTVRKKWPEMAIVYMTGYADNPAFADQKRLGPILQKPVEPSLLFKTIQDALV